MSGGHFNYDQYKISEIAEEIDQLIRINDSDEKDEWGEDISYHFNEATIEALHNAKETMRVAAIYVQRIDWMVCGDDGEATFHKRLEEDLLALQLEVKDA